MGGGGDGDDDGVERRIHDSVVDLRARLGMRPSQVD